MKVNKLLITGVVLFSLIGAGGLSVANADDSYGSWRTPAQQAGHDSWIEGQDNSAYDNGQISKNERDTEDNSLNSDRQSQENKMQPNNNLSSKSNATSTTSSPTINSHATNNNKNNKISTSNPISKHNEKHVKKLNKKNMHKKESSKIKTSPMKHNKKKSHTNHVGLVAGIIIVILVIIGIVTKLFHKKYQK